MGILIACLQIPRVYSNYWLSKYHVKIIKIAFTPNVGKYRQKISNMDTFYAVLCREENSISRHFVR